MKDFTAESGVTGDVASTDLDRTTRFIVARINLVGVQRTHFKVVHEGKGYRSFVKLRYSTDESNRLLMAEIRKNQQLYAQLQSSKSFKELDEQVQQIENQKVEEIKAMTGVQ
jgi:predicted site-specific integrase-resolvase